MAVNRNNFHIQALSTNDLASKIRLTQYKDLHDIIQRFDITGNDLLVLQEFELKIRFKNQVTREKLERFQTLLHETRTTPEKLFPSASCSRKISLYKPALSEKPKQNTIPLKNTMTKRSSDNGLQRNYSLRLATSSSEGKPLNDVHVLDELSSKFAQRRLSARNNVFRISNNTNELQKKQLRDWPIKENEQNDPFILNSKSIKLFKEHVNIVEQPHLQKEKPVLKEQCPTSAENVTNDNKPESIPQLPEKTKMKPDNIEYKNNQRVAEPKSANEQHTKLAAEQAFYDFPQARIRTESTSSYQNQTQLELAKDYEDSEEPNSPIGSQEYENSKQNYIQLQDEDIYSEVADDEEPPDDNTLSNDPSFGLSNDYYEIDTQSVDDTADDISASAKDIPPPLPMRPGHITFNLKKIKNKKVDIKPVPIPTNTESKPASNIEAYGVLPDIEIKPPTLDVEENIYEEPITLDSPRYVLQQNKFYRNFTRAEGMDYLKNACVGTYLFRSSTKPLYLAVLMIKGAVKIQNVPVSYCQEKQAFFLETELKLRDHQMFPELEDLLNYYSQHDINGDCLLKTESNYL